jgi:3-oxoacyl-(acyl-carrier-protein) synthase
VISIAGAGWLTKDKYGALKRKISDGYPDLRSLYSLLRQKSVLLYPIQGWGRFDDVSRMTCLAGGLAMSDTGVTYSQEKKQDMGIIGTNTNASLQSNVNYFKDYIENGRTLARGNLFIYTIPSSPLAEAAIYFGLTGPLFYVSCANKGVIELLDCAAHLIEGKDTDAVLAVRAEEAEAVAFVLAAKEKAAIGEICSLKEAKELLKKACGVQEIVSMLRGC